MSGTSNFLQHNPGAANQESDATYATDSIRTGGIGVDEILPSVWLNKVWFQSSTFVAAMASVIATFGSGYTITDTNITTLESQLTAFFTSLGGGVTQVNGAAGTISITAGAGIAVNTSGPNISIVNIGVVTLNGLGGSVGLLAGSNVTLASSGNNIVISAASAITSWNFSASGYVRFGNGFSIQWGTTTNFDTGPTTITFPTTFATACVCVQLTDDLDISTTGRIWEAGSLSKTGFSCRNDGMGAAFWVAFGY